MSMIYYFLMKSAELCSVKEDSSDLEVAVLKKLISTILSTQEDNIILIANGGQCVQDGLLSSYNCGDQESNPVFVYLRQQKRSTLPVDDQSPIFREFNQVKELLNFPAKKQGVSIESLKEMESMSVRVLESSKALKQLVDSSIRDQFLLVEGWTAAIANLCDSLQSIERRIVAMTDNLERFLNRDLEEGFEMMDQYERRKLELEKVPLLPCLVKEGYRDGEVPVNLLQWVLYRDKETASRVTVQAIVADAHEAYCALVGTTEGDGSTLASLVAEWGTSGMVAEVMKSLKDGADLVEKCRPVQLQTSREDSDEERPPESGQDHYTSTTAFIERLNYLTGARSSCVKLMGLVQTHREYMENIVRQCKDVVTTAVLQDHCSSSRVQMTHLHKNYTQLLEWLNTAYSSKNDLVDNINNRKNWLMKYETSICKVDETLFLAKENMKRVRQGCRVLEQMGTAPKIYVQAVVEIRRRQLFIDQWYEWGIRSSKLSRYLRRQDHEQRMMLSHDLDNHFMYSLFGSLHSFSLPKLGSQLLNSTKPTLPHISDEDIKLISDSLPNLTQFLEINQINAEAFSSIRKHQIDIFGLEDPPLEDSPPSLERSLSRPTIDSCVSIEDVSLMPVPEDTSATHLDELCFYGDIMQMKDNAVPIGTMCANGEMVDSMDFQLPNDKMTETGREMVCVPRAMLESLLVSTKELRLKMHSVESVYHDLVTQQRTFVAETSTLLEAINALSVDEGKMDVESVGCQTNQMEVSAGGGGGGDGNGVVMTFSEFRPGARVCFTSLVINGAVQWRMLSTDRKVYYLHDDCVAGAMRPAIVHRRSSAMTAVVGQDHTPMVVPPPMAGGTMAQSQQSPRMGTAAIGQILGTVWGTFLSREEYISKKMSNRFGLPVDTKFFRVRAEVDWSDVIGW